MVLCAGSSLLQHPIVAKPRTVLADCLWTSASLDLLDFHPADFGAEDIVIGQCQKLVIVPEIPVGDHFRKVIPVAPKRVGVQIPLVPASLGRLLPSHRPCQSEHPSEANQTDGPAGANQFPQHHFAPANQRPDALFIPHRARPEWLQSMSNPSSPGDRLGSAQLPQGQAPIPAQANPSAYSHTPLEMGAFPTAALSDTPAARGESHLQTLRPERDWRSL